MRFKNIFIILLIFLVFMSVSVISANNLTDDSLSFQDIDGLEVDLNDISDDSQLSISDSYKIAEGSDVSSLIHVNHNQSGEGDGSNSNPFKTLDGACKKVNDEHMDNVTINIYSGTYEMGTDLKFNAHNLNIVGIGEVIIKNKYDSASSSTAGEAFKFTSNSVNLSFSNVIFDASGYNQQPVPYPEWEYENYFYPFFGNNINFVAFDNCSFKKFNYPIIDNVEYDNWYNIVFSNCYFDITGKYGSILLNSKLPTKFSNDKFPTFENCIFILNSISDIGVIDLPCGIYINNSWFGQNNLPSYVSNPTMASKDGLLVKDWSIPVNRYAVFSVSQNYLGNNQYEIIGKLTWNGTDDQDGMENFKPMTVELKSTTGEIASTATLVNGTFKTIYTSSASTHHIETKLDNEDNQELDFTTVNVTVIAPSIKYGDDQNITINFTQSINSNVSITVNNKTYIVKVNNSNSVTYKITDVNLTKGDYLVNVTLNDDVNHVYGSNSTVLSVSKVSSYTFNTIVPSEAKVGDVVTINVELPEDVTGNVIIYVNNKQTSKQASKNTEIDISDLIVVGNNNVTVFYEGNDKYENKTSEKQIIPIDKQDEYSFEVVVPSGVKVGDDVNITIKLPGDVSGNALVYVGSQDPKTIAVSGNSTVVPVSGLVAGNNTVKVVFSDDKYAEKTVIKNITVEKLPVEITNNTIVVNAPSDSATPTVSINIPSATGNLTVIINNKTFTANLENGTATVTIKNIPAGTYNATVIYSGDNKFDQIITTANITVSEPKKQDTNTNTGGQTNKVTKTATKIVAKKKTFKAKKKVKKYTITLKAGKKPVKKVWVTLKIKGKKLLKAKTNAKGKATFKIKKLTKKGKYKATIKFKGNKNYKASSKKVKITIKK